MMMLLPWQQKNQNAPDWWKTALIGFIIAIMWVVIAPEIVNGFLKFVVGKSSDVGTKMFQGL